MHKLYFYAKTFCHIKLFFDLCTRFRDTALNSTFWAVVFIYFANGVSDNFFNF